VSSCPIYWAFPPDKSGNYRFFAGACPEGFDAIICMEVLEHLEKEESEKLLVKKIKNI